MSNVASHRDTLPGSHHLVDEDDLLREELQRLAAAQAELLELAPKRQVTDAAEVASLRADNAEFRAKLEEVDQAWGERQREYENLLEEKTEVIRSLHLKIQQLQEQDGPQPQAAEPEDLSSAKQQLEEDRRRLAEDEEALMVQMRQMEMAMSKDRAELARQRSELQRLQADLNRAIELAARDGGVRERLQALRKPNEQAPGAGPASTAAHTPPPKKKSSGLLRRIFG